VSTPVIPRSHAQVTELLGGLSLVPPGIVPVSEWRPDEVPAGVVDVYGGIGRKSPKRW
jgi:hypothetical protein